MNGGGTVSDVIPLPPPLCAIIQGWQDETFAEQAEPCGSPCGVR